uniref:(northern house mosquito) hypothetical protein n=1 Tax=Culex pipiens TaxID=7175 RepID=A0A8D8ACR3_CULPI
MHFTFASQIPPWWGALGGLKFQVIPLGWQNASTFSCRIWDRSNSTNSDSSRFPPRKFVPLSEYSSDGVPRRFTNRCRAARNPSVVREPTNSRCTALIAMHTKRHTYTFTFDLIRPTLT